MEVVTPGTGGTVGSIPALEFIMASGVTTGLAPIMVGFAPSDGEKGIDEGGAINTGFSIPSTLFPIEYGKKEAV